MVREEADPPAARQKSLTMREEPQIAAVAEGQADMRQLGCIKTRKEERERNNSRESFSSLRALALNV